MSASSYQALIQLSFLTDQDATRQLLYPLYAELEQEIKDARPGQRGQELVSFRFERLRLGIGMALMQLLTDLGGDEDSSLVRDLLEDALATKTIAEIDSIIQKKSNLFEELYTDLYVNSEAGDVLALFEDTLAAASKADADEVINRALEVARHLEFPGEGPNDDPEA